MTPPSRAEVCARVLSTTYVYTAPRVRTWTSSPLRSRLMYRKGSPWVLRCPASAKFPGLAGLGGGGVVADVALVEDVLLSDALGDGDGEAEAGDAEDGVGLVPAGRFPGSGGGVGGCPAPGPAPGPLAARRSGRGVVTGRIRGAVLAPVAPSVRRGGRPLVLQRPHLALGTGSGLAIRPPQLMDHEKEEDDPEGDGDFGTGPQGAAQGRGARPLRTARGRGAATERSASRAQSRGPSPGRTASRARPLPHDDRPPLPFPPPLLPLPHGRKIGPASATHQ